MQLLLLSDSHMSDNILDIIHIEQVDFVIHAGDSCLDENDSIFKLIDFKVKGNCDYVNMENDLYITLDNINFFITHGHLYDVKRDSNKLIEKSKDSDIIIYGHTHVVDIQKVGNKIILNPGSTLLSRGVMEESYMLLTINSKDIVIEVKSVKTNKIIKKREYVLL